VATFRALFDTNVLFGFHLNDVILWDGRARAVPPVIRADPGEELSGNLTRHGVPGANAERRISAMRHAFPDATSAVDDLTSTPRFAPV
jgi:hypothetical protein